MKEGPGKNLLNQNNYHKSIGKIIQNKFNSRNEFLSLLKNYNSMLEIGCFDKPSLEEFRKNKKVKISYADWLSKEQLQERASKIKGRNKDDVPEIKYVLAKGYEQIKFNYEAVRFSSLY